MGRCAAATAQSGWGLCSSAPASRAIRQLAGQPLGQRMGVEHAAVEQHGVRPFARMLRQELRQVAM